MVASAISVTFQFGTCFYINFENVCDELALGI